MPWCACLQDTWSITWQPCLNLAPCNTDELTRTHKLLPAKAVAHQDNSLETISSNPSALVLQGSEND